MKGGPTMRICPGAVLELADAVAVGVAGGCVPLVAVAGAAPCLVAAGVACGCCVLAVTVSPSWSSTAFNASAQVCPGALQAQVGSYLVRKRNAFGSDV